MHEGIASDVALVVDDDEIFRYAMRRTFQHAGWRAYEAANAEEALARCHEFRPALVLLDLQMPGRDGFEACTAMRAGVCPKSTMIIAVSGLARHFVEDRALRSGFDLYLLKPISENLLTRILSGLEGRRRSSVG